MYEYPSESILSVYTNQFILTACFKPVNMKFGVSDKAKVAANTSTLQSKSYQIVLLIKMKSDLSKAVILVASNAISVILPNFSDLVNSD